MATNLKRGTRIEYTYAGGKVVQGKILGDYASDMPGWYAAHLWDEHGKYGGGVHQSQVRVIRN